MPGHHDIVIAQGETFERTLKWYQDATKTNLVNLTGFAARMQVRQKHTSDEVLLSLTDGDGITLGGVLGTIAIVITDEDTAALDFDNPAYYDLELESGAGKVTRLVEGRVTLSPEITREDES